MFKKLLAGLLLLIPALSGAVNFIDGQILTASQLNSAFASKVTNGTPGSTITLSSSGIANLIVPNSGTLSTLAGTESLTNKSINGIFGLILGHGNSAATAYVGTACTNKFIRSLDQNGVATCSAVSGSDLGSTTGTGSFVLQSSPTIISPAISGSITSGTWNGTKIGLAYGGTNADLSATGGTSQVLKQTSSGGNVTVGQLSASDLSNSTTGSGLVVLATSPSLVTPTLGVASATSINKVAVTSPTTSATLTLADGSTLATSGANSVTLTSTGSTNVTLPTSGTLVNSAVTSLSSLSSVGTITSGIWNATAVTETHGGTNQTTYTTGDTLYASASNTLSKLADVATGNAIISGGVGVAPSYGKIGLTTHVSGVLAEANGGTNQSTYTTGDLLYASATNTLSKLADVAAGSFLRSAGTSTSPAWSTTTWPNSASQGDINYASAANSFVTLAKNTTATRYLANTGTSNNPAWDQVNLSNGVTSTLPVANGGTNLASGTSGGILGYTATGTLASSAALTANGVVLGGGAGATPTSTAAMTNGQLLVGQTSAAPLPKTVSGDATMAASGALTVTQINGVQPGQPNFSVYLSANQSVSSGVFTKVAFDTKNFDSGTYFDATTNRRFTPLVSGTYLISLAIYCSATAMTTANVSIYKNGTEIARGGPDAGVTSDPGVYNSTILVSLNGSTDYIEGFGRVSGSASTQFLGNSVLTYMSGYRIGP